MKIELVEHVTMLIKAKEYLVGPETDLGEKVLMVCEKESRAPAVFQVDRRKIMFAWSMDANDAMVQYAMETLEWAGWKGSFAAYPVSPSMVRYYVGEPGHIILKDCPLMPTAVPVKIKPRS